MWKLDCDFENSEYKFEQLRDEIIKIIESGDLDFEKPLPNINEVSNYFKLSKVTVSRAYNHLKKRGIISNIRGKFYVVTEKANRLKILLVFNKLEDYKRDTYEAIQSAFNGNATIDLQVYYSNYTIFKRIINESLNKYDYYLIMPHFYKESLVDDNYELLKKIRPEKLLFLDNLIPEISNFRGAVIQEFGDDMLLGLEKTKDLLSKYVGIHFIRREHSHHPEVAINALTNFCKKNNLTFNMIHDIEKESITPKIAYISTTDKDLAQLVKKIRTSVYKIGEDIGIISYNETILKELLNVTVFSTNFHKMGEMISRMIIDQDFSVKKNPFDIIIRDTL
jgi:DNA-binding transcriptional regulator YhcF (GntR family)